MKLSNNKQGIIFDKTIQKPSAMFLSTTGQGELSYYNGDFHFAYSDGSLLNVKDLDNKPDGDTGDLQLNNNDSFGITSDILTNYVFGIYDGTGDEPAGLNFADYDVTGNNLLFTAGSTDGNSFSASVYNSATSGTLSITPDTNRLYHTVTDTTGTTGMYGINGSLTLIAYTGTVNLDSETFSVTDVPFVLNSISTPSVPSEGMVYYNSTDSTFYGYDGTDWKDLAGGSPTSGSDGYLQLNNGGVLGTSTDILTNFIVTVDDESIIEDPSFYVGDTSGNSYFRILYDTTSGITTGMEAIFYDSTATYTGGLSIYPGTGLDLGVTNSDGGATINIANDRLTIAPALRLNPTTSATSTPAKGDIYVSDTDSSIHFYNGTAWYTLDMTAD